MAYTAPTVAQLRAEVMSRCGRLLADAGLYVPRVDGSIAPIDYGLAIGAMDTGMALSNPLALTDAEAANLSPFGVERALMVAEHHCLKLIVQGFYRVVQTHMADPLSPQSMNSGWLLEQKQGVKDHRDELALILKKPFRDTTEQMVVGNALGPFGYLGGDAVYPGYWPSFPLFDPAFFPFGYRSWGCR